MNFTGKSPNTNMTPQMIRTGFNYKFVTRLTIKGAKKLPSWLVPSISPHPVD